MMRQILRDGNRIERATPTRCRHCNPRRARDHGGIRIVDDASSKSDLVSRNGVNQVPSPNSPDPLDVFRRRSPCNIRDRKSSSSLPVVSANAGPHKLVGPTVRQRSWLIVQKTDQFIIEIHYFEICLAIQPSVQPVASIQ